MSSISRSLAAGAACLLLGTGVQAASFTPLGDLPGGDFFSWALDVSDDGSVVVGLGTTPSGMEAFRWTRASGMTGLGDFAGGEFFSWAFDASADGSVVVGFGTKLAGFEAFRWSTATGLLGLGDLPGGVLGSMALGVSADGSVVVGGGSGSGGYEAFRWTSGGGMVGLGDLPGGLFWSEAAGVSADGNVVVGEATSAWGPAEAFRWTSAGGMVGLGDLPGGAFESFAWGVSADGSVVVGGGTSAWGPEAFRWTSAGGMVGLGDLPGGAFASVAERTSADGSVAVGTGMTAAGPEGFIWTQAGGMRRVLDVLVANGVTGLHGWMLNEANAISADGRWIVGIGTNPSGDMEAWLAEVDVSAIDSDGDGVPDGEDAFPNDPSEWLDTDEDGIGNNADPDDDNDGIPDDVDPYPLGRFNDVSPNHWAVTFIERLAESGITAGCGNDNYCPTSAVTRAQMAVFLERGMHGSGYGPPAPTGNVFNDVSANHWAASFIEQFFLDGITAGCGNNNYCPEADVNRDQMAVFLLRAKHGAGYSPPPATGVFNDVALGHWAVHWIEQLAAEGITAGCGNNNYCPDAPVNRDQMAVFLIRTFGL